MNQQTIKPQYTIATNHYGHYCIPLSSSHRPCAQTILAGDVHEPDTIQFILDHAGDGDVIHAGAYFGDMLPALSGWTNKVWAFEPGPENFMCAEVTRLINNLDNVNLFDAGLGEKTTGLNGGPGYLQTEDGDRDLGGGSTRLIFPNALVSPFDTLIVSIELVTIDALFDDPYIPISIIHLDIEGSEQLALTGAMDTITRCKPILILETLPDNEWIDRNLTGLGYKITGKVHSNSILECVK